MILTTPIDRRLQAHMMGMSSELRTQFINWLIARHFNDYSYAMIIKDSSLLLNNYLGKLTNNTIGISRFNTNASNTILSSNSIQYNGFDGIISATLSTNVCTITARFESISKLLRSNLKNDLAKRSILDIEIIHGSKHTEIGYRLRNYSDIDKVDVTKICDYIKDIIIILS